MGIFSRWTNVITIAALFIMICITFVDAFMRYIFDAPMPGVNEVTEVLLVCAVFFAVAHTLNEKGHVHVDLITAKLAPKVRLVLEFTTNLPGLGIFIFVVWLPGVLK